MIPGLLALFLLAGQDTLAPTLAGASYLEGARVTVSFMPADSGKARSVVRALDATPPLPGLPPEFPDGVRLVLAPDEATFDQLAGGQAPDWGAAVALTTRSTILLPAFVSSRGAGWSEHSRSPARMGPYRAASVPRGSSTTAMVFRRICAVG